MSALLALALACTSPSPSSPAVPAPAAPVPSTHALGLDLTLPADAVREDLGPDQVLFRWGEQALELRRGAGADLASWRAGLALVGEATLGPEQATRLCGRAARRQAGTVHHAGGRGWVAGPGGARSEVVQPARTVQVAAVVDDQGRRLAWSAPGEADPGAWEAIVQASTCGSGGPARP